MKITPLKTNDGTVSSASKVLLYGHHGAGKTTQIKNYSREFGKGLILSGESGLSSIADIDVDYIPFTSFDRDPKDGYSFKQIMTHIMSDEFKSKEYKWIAIDSISELSQRCFADVLAASGKDNITFEEWANYERKITFALKWVRDLPMHVLITALAVEESDDNGVTNYWPSLVQKKIQKGAPALFDHVFCLLRKTQEQGGKVDVKRFIVTDEVRGWHGKARDAHRRLSPIEDTDDVTDLLKRIYMTEDQFADYQRKGEAA